ncbi:hypothetical protein PR003_g25732 [Phytophthora rubi]|uniref:Fe2OG dioxygenase domain-containing protein n=1 Tax=Phytophthora rubi TaxID=129364 RepID=A0A6A3I4J8_9STRA|nr:hypothetical protein PR002_g24893 [Phytophthora rubi]KAE8979316.1 hypothetical protein PR001_g24590 [Phytophthora rubi]KAE9288736.1 hypothetical protein PR003_g25732 [Phytophthora rubi]
MAAGYKASEKRWKRATDEELRTNETLLDPRNLSKDQQAKVQCVGSWKWRPEDEERPVLAFDASHRGFCVIPNAINAMTQLQFAHSCLTEFTEEPHVTNMHLQNQQVAEIWRKARESHPKDPTASPLLSKLCWAASGYHYDWTARKYYRHSFSAVPELLQQLGSRCASACGMTLSAEAVIVNFYKSKSSMGGHLDDVEYTMDHPVVSLSLGSRCVFLMGGHSKDEPPLEILLRSGDIAIMGRESRTCYHGVARVLPTPFDVSNDEYDALLQSEDDREECEAVRTYLGTQRININVRQVFPLEPASPSTD